ncbi:MAG: diacylglycerol/lipid kinase family protein [Thermoplasmata archaeon]
MKAFFIVNPVAGNGRGKRVWEEIRDKLFKSIGEQDYKFTDFPGDATDLARDAVDRGYDTIVSCGGDGTVNEVLNGLVNSNVNFTILPLGTGSDFGKTVGIRSYEDTIRALKGSVVLCDVGKVYFYKEEKERYFLNILEIGFGAEVMEYVNTHKKHRKYAFLIGVIATVMKMRKFRIELDHNSESLNFESIEAIVANGKYFGGGMLASPNSKINDGELDVHILKAVSKLKTLTRLRDLINGTYIEKGYSHDFQIDKIDFKGEEQLVEMDGEVVGRTPISITIEKKAVKLLVPE